MQSSKKEGFRKSKGKQQTNLCKQATKQNQINETGMITLGYKIQNKIRSTRLPKQMLQCSNNENQVTSQVKRARKSQTNRLRRMKL